MLNEFCKGQMISNSLCTNVAEVMFRKQGTTTDGPYLAEAASDAAHQQHQAMCHYEFERLKVTLVSS